ncbi:MAG TPA: class I SAM-dependent methyltransferase, partial [Planctomycetota bacterium]|nr:class I SAM-dependent methyltransferase [Planctomycetota bacterium]
PTLRHRFVRSVYRLYRRLKVHFLKQGPTWTGKLFFRLVQWMDDALSPRQKKSDAQLREDAAWKAAYEHRFGVEPLYRVESAHPVAVSSDDHKHPRGSIYDNSVHAAFNARTNELFGQRTPLKLLDLGCAGGGLVRSFLAEGHVAVGLEGSDHSLRLKTGEWGLCPLHLFTCDLTHPFRLLDRDGRPMMFDIITSWEVLEHIPEGAVGTLIASISNHLAQGGIFVGSVDTDPDGNLLSGATYHVTLKPKPWWLEAFARGGLIEVFDHPYRIEDFVRGNGLGFKDWDPRDGTGFHLVMKRSNPSGRSPGDAT